jgi:hypothetical protein
MEIAAVIISLFALAVSGVAASRQLVLARHANAMPVLVDLFREHRSDRLAEARRFVCFELENYALNEGMDGLPEDKRTLVRDLAWFYDNLGALVTHNVVDVGAVSGYLGGAVVTSWTKIKPLVEAERKRRTYLGNDPRRWQEYFENLYCLVQEMPPKRARAKEKKWRIQYHG